MSDDRLLEYFDSLSHEQHEAAIETEGDALVEAAPGAGKTRTLVAKALAEAENRPVYVMTFTTSAAEEIAERMKVLEVPEHKHWEGIRHLGTLHSWCLGFMRSCGCTSELIDDSGLATVAQEVNDRLRLHLSQKQMEEVLGGVPPRNYNERQFKDAHYKSMQENGLLSYDGVLQLARDYLALAPPRWRSKPVLLVDEIQDSSPDDLRLYEAFSRAGAELWLVGDLEQAIYSFRHPEPVNVWEWWKARGFMGGSSKVVNLSTNYRSSQAVVKALNLINAPFQPRVEIKAKEDAAAGQVDLLSARSEAELLQQLYNRILNSLDRALPEELGRYAVLCRTNRECELVANTLKGQGLSVRQKRPDLPERVPAILWAALGLFRQPNSDWMAKRYLRAIGADAESAQRNAAKSMKSIGQTLYPAFFAVDRLPGEWPKWMDILQVPKAQQGWFFDRMTDGWSDGSWDDIVMRLFESPVEEETGQGITVTTIHAAKGREWWHVLMPFCDQHSYRPKNGVEEERVFFVGASRAIETLTFLYSKSRIDQWKGGEFDVAMYAPLERVVEGSKGFKKSTEKKGKRSRRTTKHEKKSQGQGHTRATE